MNHHHSRISSSNGRDETPLSLPKSRSSSALSHHDTKEVQIIKNPPMPRLKLQQKASSGIMLVNREDSYSGNGAHHADSSQHTNSKIPSLKNDTSSSTLMSHISASAAQSSSFDSSSSSSHIPSTFDTSSDSGGDPSVHSGKLSDFLVSPRAGADGSPYMSADDDAVGVLVPSSQCSTGSSVVDGSVDSLSVTSSNLTSRDHATEDSSTSAAPPFKNTCLYTLQPLHAQTQKKETIIFFPPSVSKSQESIQEFLDTRYPSRTINKIEKHDVTFKFSQKVIKYNSVKGVITKSGVKYHYTGKKYPKRNKSEYFIKWGLNQTTKAYSKLTKYQVFNHFPGSYSLGRKDSLYRHLDAMRRQHGYNEFPFFPKSWILPSQKKELKAVMQDDTNSKKSHGAGMIPAGKRTNMFIMKPASSCCGRGISIVRSYDQVKKKIKNSTGGWIVQDYIANPLLLNGRKFDLRLYVVITSYDPLRVYLFNDGLCRISTKKYSLKKDSRFIHLTNFSVHKKSKSFVKNSDASADGEGHKWSLPALKRYLKENGIDDTPMWDSVKDLIIKTILSVESKINQLTKKSLNTKENVLFELLGFDVLIDEDLKPHIIEVNCGPSLSQSSPLDKKIKTNLLADIYTMVGVQPVSRKTLHKEKLNQRNDRVETRSTAHVPSHTDSSSQQSYKRSLAELMRLERLDFLTDDDIHVVTEADEEYSRKGGFERLFPTKRTWSKYQNLFPCVRYRNLLLHLYLSNSSSRRKALLHQQKKYAPPSSRPAFVPSAMGHSSLDYHKMDPEFRRAQKKYKKIRSRYKRPKKNKSRSVAKHKHSLGSARLHLDPSEKQHNSSAVELKLSDSAVQKKTTEYAPSALRRRSQSAPSNRPNSARYSVSEMQFPMNIRHRVGTSKLASPRSLSIESPLV